MLNIVLSTKMMQKTIENKMFEVQFDFLKRDRELINDNPKIKIIGIGGAGNNIINSLFQFDLPSELISFNTDWKQLSSNKADKKLLIGYDETKGLGCGGDVIKGKNAAIESMNEIKIQLTDTELLIFVGGLGRGTVTGGLAQIAKKGKELGALTVAFLTIPFFTLKSEVEKAMHALEELDDVIDTIILLDNNKLLDLQKDLTLLDSFAVMNEIMYNSIYALISLIRENEIIEIDFSNLKSVLDKGGFGTIGLAQMNKNDSLENLIDNALHKNLSYFDVENAKTALVKVMGDSTLDLNTLNEIAEKLKKFTSLDSEVLITAKIDESLKGVVKLFVIFGGISLDNLILDKAVKKLREGLYK